MKYKTVYPCWIVDEIRNGRKVYVLDRKLKKISYVNEASVEAVVRLMECTETEPGRYDFWYEVEKEETETEDGKL